MIRTVLEHIRHIEVFPIISLVLFILVFAGATLWAMSLGKSRAAAYGRMPLEDSTDDEGGNRHE
jgi:cbb3-type cytochrome oxidase subunit 3